MNSLKEIQDSIRIFTESSGSTCKPDIRLLDLLSELGEVTKELLKGSGYGKKQLSLPEGWSEELGDLLFSLICLANESDVDLEDALGKVVAKYKRRVAERGDSGSGS